MAYNILIVDDSSVTRTVMAKTIQMSGVDVGELFFAGDGKEALEQLKTCWPDLVFCDINMPVMDGMAFVRELRKSKEWDDLPVVIVSTEGSQTRIDDLLAKGIRGYIRKPFTPEQIAAMIEEVLGENQHV